MTLKELHELLGKIISRGRCCDDKIVVACKTVGASIGGSPYAAVSGLTTGFDWDAGVTFLHTHQPVTYAGYGYERDNIRTYEHCETLAHIQMTLRDRRMDSATKNRAISMTIRMMDKRIKERIDALGGGDE